MSKRFLQTVAAAADKPAEILVHGPIGKSFWSDEGISGKEFTDALNAIPEGTKVVVGLNTQGGSVSEGLAIANAIERRAQDVTVRVDGYALSIGSYFPLKASKVISPKSSIWMIHKAWNYAAGNADELRKNAEMLDTHDDVLVAGYMERTGKSEKEIRAALSEETWMTGEEAVAYGLADEMTDDDVKIEPMDFAAAGWQATKAQKVFAARLLPAASATKTTTPMTQDPKPAEPTASAQTTPPKADAAPAQAANVVSLEAFNALQSRIAAQDRRWIEHKVDAALATRRYLDREDSITRALADEKYLDVLAKLPEDANAPMNLGAVNAGNPAIEEYRKIGPSCSLARSGETPSISFAVAQKRIAHRKEHGAQIEAQMQRHLPQAANTISSTLKPDVLSDGLVVVAHNRLAAVRAFSRLFTTDAMRPGASLAVKKATAGATGQSNPTNWESGDSTLDVISVSLAHKTQSFQLSSSDRNYGFGFEDIAAVNANAFSNLLSDVYTAVMTVANYGAALSVGVAATFQYDSLKPVLAAAKNYRSKNLLIDGGHRAYLAPTDKFGFEFANNGVPAFGFDLLAEQNRWTSAATNACGFVCSPDALAVASGAPSNPASSSFDMVGSFTLGDIGLTVLYTSWFNTATRIQWASYETMFGAAAGDTTQAEVLVTS